MFVGKDDARLAQLVEQPVYTGKVGGSSPSPRTGIFLILTQVRTLWYNPCMPYNSKEKLYEAQKRHRIRVRQKVLEFLSSKECVDCGEKDPIVLDFDHSGSKEKFKDVSRMLSGHYSWESVLKEIRKCEIRCANCHRRKTYFQFKFFGKTKTL